MMWSATEEKHLFSKS